MATDATTAAPGQPAEVDYPVRDGKPMAETEFHQEAMIELIQGLRDRYSADPQVYVAGNMFLYFVEGNPRRNVSPDVMVIKGVPKTVRACYKTWEEGGKAPNLVVEVSSKSTRREDLRGKMALYRDELRVPEYFLFDPLGEYLRPRFRGFRLAEGRYEPIVEQDGRLPSAVLGLHLEAVGPTLRLWDPATGRIIPNRLEALAAAQQEGRRRTRAIREQAAALADRDMTLRERDLIIDRKDLTIGQLELKVGQQELTIGQLELKIAQQDLTIGQLELKIGQQELTIGRQELTIGRGELERDRLRAELDRLGGKDGAG